MYYRDIILVEPPQKGLLNGFANGLLDLANFVAGRAPKSHVQILDLGFASALELRDQACASLVRCKKAAVVGITTTTASYQAALATARAFKAADPDCFVVLGGHHATPQHEIILRRHKKIVDGVVRGEGERALLALAEGKPLADIPGLSFLKGERLVANASGPLLSQAELDSLPVTFEGRNFQSALGKFEHVTYVSARGCPLQCAFCAVAGQKIRAKSVDCVVADLRHLVQDLAYDRIAIEDNFFAQNKRRTLELCDSIRELRADLRSDFMWDCQTRVESISTPIVEALENAGCEAAYLGVESLDEQELVYLAKTPDPTRYAQRVTNVVSRMVESRVACHINIQVGLPDEDDQKRETRRNRLEELGCAARRRGRTITVFPQLHVVYPGTQHFWKGVQESAFGDRGRSLEVFETFTEWESSEEPILRFLGENFAHGVGGLPLGIIDRSALRHGDFQVEEDSVERLRAHLDELSGLDGIELFKYGEHIVSNGSHTEKLAEEIGAFERSGPRRCSFPVKR